MAEQKPSSKEKLKEIISSIETGIQELFQSEKFADYLRTMSRFHRYSVNNTILIHLQRPNAAMPVAGFRKWQQFGRYVKKGEKGLTIIAPTPCKKKIEEMRLDPDTKAPILDQDGNAIMDEKIIEIPLFKPVKVFSADQTDGEPLPSLVADLSGDVQQYEAFMEALRRTSPMPIVFGTLEPGTDGLCSFSNQSITIRAGMSQVQTVCATVHEIGHAVLHGREEDRLSAAAGDTDKEPPKAKDERTMEVEAESVSFAVCQYYGIDTSANSLGYIAGWSKDKSLPELKASLETITKAVSGLISSIDKHFAEICKERGIDLTAQPDQTPPPPAEQPEEPQRDTALDEYPMPDNLFTAEELQQDYGYLDGDMLPLSKDRAAELLAQDFTVYTIVDGGSAEMVFDRDELDEHPPDRVYAVSKEEWEVSPDFQQAVADRMNRQEERERAFLDHSEDCFAIYQLRHDETTRYLIYEPLERIRQAGESPRKGNYELAYTGELTGGQGLSALDNLWEKFNTDPPADYLRPSRSVSDIVALKQDDVVSCYYVERFGFSALSGFFQAENYLKNAEMAVEDDYNMIDGINNGPKEPVVTGLEAQAREKQSKKSVVRRLKNHPKQERKQSGPKRMRKRSGKSMTDELVTFSMTELMADVVKIQQTGVPCGLSGQRIEPGFVLANGTVLLESEKDEKGRYIGGAGMDGMYLRTNERYEPLIDEDGTLLAFRRVDSDSVMNQLLVQKMQGKSYREANKIRRAMTR